MIIFTAENIVAIFAPHKEMNQAYYNNNSRNPGKVMNEYQCIETWEKCRNWSIKLTFIPHMHSGCMLISARLFPGWGPYIVCIHVSVIQAQVVLINVRAYSPTHYCVGLYARTLRLWYNQYMPYTCRKVQLACGPGLNDFVFCL